jgi:hypothetical protein
VESRPNLTCVKQGTNWQPVKLDKPKKLVNPFAAREAQALADAQGATQARPAPRSTGKLTWSERQAMAKKQRDEDEAKSRQAITVGAVAAGTGIIAGAGAMAAANRATEPDEDDWEAPVPPPPPPVLPSRPQFQTESEPVEEEEAAPPPV